MQRHDAGFSLIELLVSLAVLASVSLMLMSGLHLTKGIWQRQATIADLGQSISAAQSALRASIEPLVPATRYDSSAPYADFKGESGSLEYLARAVDIQQPNGLLRYKLALKKNGQLQLSSRNDMAFSAIDADMIKNANDNSILLRRVKSLQIDYYGKRSSVADARWHRRWESEAAPPELIRIRITFVADETAIWPELIIRPAVMIDVDCILVAISTRCQGRA